MEFTYCQCSTIGYEILSPDGVVIAWTVDAGWAGIVVGLLNHAEKDGLANMGQGLAPVLSRQPEVFIAWNEIPGADQPERK